MADPIPPLAVSVVVVGLCAGVDWLARRAGVYVGSEVAWPERVRVRTRAVAGDQPYRAALTHDARRAIAEGVPAPVSTATIVTGAIGCLWTLALLLGLGDVWKGFDGRRSLSLALASLGWCLLRAAGGWAMVTFAWLARGRHLAVAALATAGMDCALWLWPVPCSDVRADDVAMARAGLATTGLLALGFAVAWGQRRGTVTAASLRAMN